MFMPPPPPPIHYIRVGCSSVGSASVVLCSFLVILLFFPLSTVFFISDALCSFRVIVNQFRKEWDIG